MTQTSLSFTLADRACAWADANEGGTFADLCDAMGADATSVDVAARGCCDGAMVGIRWDGPVRARSRAMTNEELKEIEERAASFMGRYVARDGLCGAIPAGEELATDATALCAAVRERDATIARLEAALMQARKVIEGTVTALSVSPDPQMATVRALLIVALSVPS